MERQANKIDQLPYILSVDVDLSLQLIVSAPQPTVLHYDALQVIQLDLFLFSLAECHVTCLLRLREGVLYECALCSTRLLHYVALLKNFADFHRI